MRKFFQMPVSRAHTTSLADILPKGHNNFDLIRLLAAIGVIFAHSFALFPDAVQRDPFISAALRSIGSICVCIFFFVSGILITASFNRSGSPVRFILMRVGRIWPAIIVCLIITTFVLGPIVSSLSANEYFGHPGTLHYFFKNIRLSSITFQIPGVFNSNFYKDTVNGSLWTLPIELACYSFVLFAGLMGCLTSRKTLNFTCLFVGLMYLDFPIRIVSFSGPAVIPAGCFLLGAIYYANSDAIPVNWKISAPILFWWFLVYGTPQGEVAFYVLLGYIVILLAAAKPLQRISLQGDYSYGIYVYGFVVQQTVYYYFPHLGSVESNFVTIPICIGIGFLSWNFVEKPALRLFAMLSNSIDDWLHKATNVTTIS